MTTAIVKVPVFYVAHPVGSNPEIRLVNIDMINRWLVTLVENAPDVAFSIPWLPYVTNLDESTHRERGIRDDISMLARHDGVVALGAGFETSAGMRAEWDHAVSISLVLIDLTKLSPPVRVHDEVFTPASTRKAIADAFGPAAPWRERL